MARLVFDIETAGKDFETLDKKSQEQILRNAQRYCQNEQEVEERKNKLSFSPLLAEVVAVGMLNPDTNQGKVFYQDRSNRAQKSVEENVEYLPMEEKEILDEFWRVAKSYDEFITFNGRGFDVPFLSVRSAIHGLRPSKDLMSNRYLSSQRFAATHIDLFDQLTYYGAAFSQRQSLHLYCEAFGIKSPKNGDISGQEVKQAFKDGRYLGIAQYCMNDVWATAQLYEYWDKYLRF